MDCRGMSLLLLATGLILASLAVVEAQMLIKDGGNETQPRALVLRDMTDHERLLQYLFQPPYDLLAFPVLNASFPTMVTFGVTLVGLDLAENGLLKAGLWYNVEWRDPRLAFEPGQFGGIDSFRVDPTKIWVPDVALYNSMIPKMPLSPRQPGGLLSQAIVSSDGKVALVEPVQDEVFCRTDNKQNFWSNYTCQFKFGSWTHSGWSVDLELKSSQMEAATYVDNGIQVLSNKASRHEVYYECCPEPYVDVSYDITIRRSKMVTQQGIVNNPDINGVLKN